MTNLKLFDKIMLKTGEIAYIVEVLHAPGKPTAYICDIESQNGTDTDFVYSNDIAKVIG